MLKMDVVTLQKVIINKGSIYDDPKTLDFYAMKRFTEINLVNERTAMMKKLKGIENSLNGKNLKVQKTH